MNASFERHALFAVNHGFWVVQLERACVEVILVQLAAEFAEIRVLKVRVDNQISKYCQ